MSLQSLSGIEGLAALEDLELGFCGVTSLQLLANLVAPGIKRIRRVYRGKPHPRTSIPKHRGCRVQGVSPNPGTCL